jgi:hypothetical protein
MIPDGLVYFILGCIAIGFITVAGLFLFKAGCMIVEVMG